MAPILSTLRPLNVGDVVLDMKPIIHVISHEFKGKYCDTCLKKSDSLKKCSKCLKMHYCDKNCQRIDWKYHKNECKLFSRKNFNYLEYNTEDILFTRFWLSVKSDPQMCSQKYQLLDGSDFCLNDFKLEDKNNWQQLSYSPLFVAINRLFASLQLDYNREEVLHWCGIFISSFMTYILSSYQSVSHPLMRSVTNLSINKLGLGLYPQLSSVGHSCAPNAAVVTKDLSIELRVIEPIAVGQQITRNYIDLNQNKSDRQKELKSQFLINCKCLKCEQNLDSNIDYKKFNHWVNYMTSIQSMIGSNVYSVLKDLEKSKEEMFQLFKQVYGEYHPDRADILGVWMGLLIKVKTMEKPSLNIEKDYKEVRRTMGVSFGENHPTVQHFDRQQRFLASILNLK